MRLRTLTIAFLFLPLFILVACQSNVAESKSYDQSVVTPKAFTAKEAQMRDEKLKDSSTYDGQALVFDDYEGVSWSDLKKVTFEEKFYKDIDSYLLFPTFSSDVKSLEGKKIAIEGYVIPLSPGRYVLSANPFASCFFCGNAGPESVMELFLQDTSKIYFSDEFRGFAGVLELNDSDIDHMNYMLKDAVPVKP